MAWIELRPFDPDRLSNNVSPVILPESSGTPEESADAFINETDNRTDTQTYDLTKTDTNAEQQNTPSDSPVLSKISGGSDRSSEIQSGSGSKSKNLSSKLFAQTLALKLNLPSTDPKQLQADTRCFVKAAEAHIIPGLLGDPKEAAERCYAKAENIAQSQSLQQRRRARVWVGWFKKELQKKGYEWGN